ncbi:MAG: LLM class flavin-dependent oxidoreductase [Candidatus Tectomicrobia bacterium]|nr:LLM class flavin-dependent oxidoreductase [Candidatus Tectomicrobia bacterium]
MVKFSVRFIHWRPLKEFIRVAQMMEAAGVDEVSIADDFTLDVPMWPVLFAIADNTQKITVGPGLTHPYIRHPSDTAKNLSLLDRVSNGRAVLEVGRGQDSSHQLMGVKMPKPMQAVREFIQVVRHYLRGEKKPFRGEVFTLTENAFLRWPVLRPELRIILGTRGPKMIQLAGELCDEAELAFCAMPFHMAEVRENIKIGAARAGRNAAKVDIGVSPLIAISDNKDEAIAHARRVLPIVLHNLKPLDKVAGIERSELDTVEALFYKGQLAEASKHISERSIASFSVCGNTKEFIAQTEALINAGVQHFCFLEPGPDPQKSLELIAKQVVPYFKGK